MISQPRRYYYPLFAVSIISSLLLLFHRSWLSPVLVIIGLPLGAILPDFDHLIYWFFRFPQDSASVTAKELWKSQNYRQLIRHLQAFGPTHTDLIFHHFSGHVVITLLSVFIFSSSSSLLAQSITLGLNIHLLTDVIVDFKTSPAQLQRWLFAREPKQLPLPKLKYYVLALSLLNLLYLGLFLSNL